MIRIQVPYQIYYCVIRKDKTIEQINQFENYKNYQLNANGFCKSINFKMQETISLKFIIDLIENDYIRIYKGQLIIIIEAILNHLIELHYQKLTHGQLYPQNIFISFGNNTGLTSTFQKIEIKQIHFIRYKYFEDSDYQINYEQDIQQILKSIMQFIVCVQTKYDDCDILSQINLFFYNQQKNSQQIDLRELLKQLDLLNQKISFDRKQQKVESNEIETKLIEIFKARKTFQTPLQSVIEILSEHNLNEKVKIVCDDKLNCSEKISQIEKFIDFNQIENKIFAEVFELKLRVSIVTQLFIFFGKYFGQSKTEAYSELLKFYEIEINQNLQQFFNYMFPQIIKEYENVQQSIEVIKKQIKNPFKEAFQIEIPKDLTQILFLSELKILLDDFNIFNQNPDIILQQTQEKFKKRLTNYYLLNIKQENIKFSSEII